MFNQKKNKQEKSVREILFNLFNQKKKKNNRKKTFLTDKSEIKFRVFHYNLFYEHDGAMSHENVDFMKMKTFLFLDISRILIENLV